MYYRFIPHYKVPWLVRTEIGWPDGTVKQVGLLNTVLEAVSSRATLLNGEIAVSLGCGNVSHLGT